MGMPALCLKNVPWRGNRCSEPCRVLLWASQRCPGLPWLSPALHRLTGRHTPGFPRLSPGLQADPPRLTEVCPGFPRFTPAFPRLTGTANTDQIPCFAPTSPESVMQSELGLNFVIFLVFVGWNGQNLSCSAKKTRKRVFRTKSGKSIFSRTATSRTKRRKILLKYKWPFRGRAQDLQNQHLPRCGRPQTHWTKKQEHRCPPQRVALPNTFAN